MELTQEEHIDIEELKKKLKDEIPQPIMKTINKFNDIIDSINAFEDNIDSLTPFQLAKLEHYYNKIQREVWKIAGYYKSQYQYYYGKASTDRGQTYIYGRTEHKFKVNDANYRSKVEEGINLEISGIYEGYYVTWQGIAKSYEGAVNTVKDMIKAIDKEGGNQ